MSQVSLGRPEFVPGTPPQASDRQIPLCDFSLSVFFSPQIWGGYGFSRSSGGGVSDILLTFVSSPIIEPLLRPRNSINKSFAQAAKEEHGHHQWQMP